MAKKRVNTTRKVSDLTSLRQLAAALGKSHVAVSKIAKRGDWPFSPPFDAAQVRAWWAKSVTGAGAPDPDPIDPADAIRSLGPERQLKLKYLAARIQKLEFEHKVLLDTMVPRADVEREQLARVMAVRSELMNTPRLMAMLASAASPAEQEEKIREWAKGICDRFAGGAGGQG